MSKQKLFMKKINSAALNLMTFLMTEEIDGITQEQILGVRYLLHQIIMASHEEKWDELVSRVMEILASEVFLRITRRSASSRIVKEFAGCCCICNINTNEEYYDEFKTCIRNVIVILGFLVEAEEFVRTMEDSYDIELEEVRLLKLLLIVAEQLLVLEDEQNFTEVIQSIDIPIEWVIYNDFRDLERRIYFHSQAFSDEIEECN